MQCNRAFIIFRPIHYHIIDKKNTKLSFSMIFYDRGNPELQLCNRKQRHLQIITLN